MYGTLPFIRTLNMKGNQGKISDRVILFPNLHHYYSHVSEHLTDYPNYKILFQAVRMIGVVL